MSQGDAVACCPWCRLIQPGGPDDLDAHGQASGRCAHCGAAGLVWLDYAPDRLLRARIDGVSTARKPPPTGDRDTLALVATAVATVSAAVAGTIAAEHPVGLLAGPAVGLFGWSKQFWRTVLLRRRRLRPVPPPEAPLPVLRPDGLDARVGVAQPWQRSVRAVGAGEDARAALVCTLVLWSRGGVLLRHVRAEPFWVVGDDGDKALVAGACWAALHPPPARTERPADAETVRGLLERLSVPRAVHPSGKVLVQQAQIEPGERVRVCGALRQEHVAGAGAYRDATVAVVRGEPGNPVWIERA